MTKKQTPAVFHVLLSNRGNPDYHQDPDKPMHGTPDDAWFKTQDIEAAKRLCHVYIADHDLGGGNWTGGVVLQTGGNVIGALVLGKIAYNGEFFPLYHRGVFGKPSRIQCAAIEDFNRKAPWVKMPANLKRHARAIRALEEYVKGQSIEEAMTDLLTDLRHLADAQQIEWAKVLRMAVGHHRAEMAENTPQ
jgi:hypothetical protein